MKREFLMNLGLDHRAVSAVMAENGRDVEAVRAMMAEKDHELDALKRELSEKETACEQKIKEKEAAFRAEAAQAEEKHRKEMENLRAEEQERLRVRGVYERAGKERFASAFAEEAACAALIKRGPDADADEFYRNLRESDPSLFLPEEDAAPVPVFSAAEPDSGETEESGKFELPLRYVRAK